MKIKLIATIPVISLALFASASTAADLPNFKAINRGALADDSIYFVMTDRFANGNTANDEAFVGGGLLKSGYDPTNPL